MAIIFTGVCYENGIGVKQNINKAIERYSLATRDGDSQAMYNLAACYETTASLNENGKWTIFLFGFFRRVTFFQRKGANFSFIYIFSLLQQKVTRYLCLWSYTEWRRNKDIITLVNV